MKQELLDALSEMAYLEPNKWKSRSYSTARSILSSIDEEELISRTNYRDLPGIGASINAKILDFKKDGSINKLNELRSKYLNKLDPRIYKIRKSYITRRIPLKDAKVLYRDLINILGVPEEDVTLCGSARRKSELVGDLDIVIKTTDKYLLTKLKNKLSKHFEVTVSGDKKLSFIIQESTMTPVDIYVTEPKYYWYMVLYLTGSGNFNIKMRSNAKKLGYKLSQYGLEDKNGNNLLADSEETIFRYLNMKYIYPENR